jgi:hypothetical protein
MQKFRNKKVNLNKIELIYATIFFVAGKLLDVFVGSGIALITMLVLMLVFMILLIVFFRQHTYGQDKPLLVALSIYGKSAAYMAVIFTMSNLGGRLTITTIAMFSLIFYAVLSYVFGKKYNEMLNAYLYLCLMGFAIGTWV